jgi:drug/metabolite transporter (DMT)-like permease
MDARLIVAITAVWLLWGSTYAAMRYAVGTMPPFAMASVRFTIAGAILFAICLVRGRARPTRRDLVRAVVTGATLLLFGNGMTAWTVQYLPSGVNALLLSVAPIWMALIAFVWGGERPTRLSLAGMLLGLAGIALLVRPSAASPLPLWPVTVSIFAGVAWSFGSIYQRRMGRSDDVVLGTALQMLAGGLLLGLEAALTGQWSALHIHAVSAASWCALGWLIVFGGVIAYSAYLYTMHAASTALASTYAYVNPIVAVALGFVLFGERLTPIEMVASAIIVTGVALMMLPPRATAVRVGGG